MEHGSHVNFFAKVAQTLKIGGHNPMVLVQPTKAHFPKKYGVHFIDMGPNVSALESWAKEDFFNKNPIVNLFSNYKLTRNLCENVLSEEILMQQLEMQNFALTLIDRFDILRCMYIIPHRLKVQHITMSAWIDPWMANRPALPSIEDLVRNSAMRIINMDTICLDFPRVQAYHYQFIPCLGCALPNHWKVNWQSMPTQQLKRITARNYGRVVNIREFTKDELYEAIADVLGNQTYADNIQKCSRIFHSMRDPHETLLFWVDHVLRFGGDHLRPTYMDLTLWKFFMLDVVGAILVFLLATVYCIWKLTKKMFS
ncbi:hypothetical protein CAPTEDRAFT_205364 [Capitella teleta]|uniref:Glucuronosyltransferase n=1 Tax=Capitella teleta TaxID=283909 RepID=R7TMX6_CAPTE|nr:hypothetical protein CAPTEDRAFT_205364 [Capitella teleta]|eukprot:ELT94862.1 hypothetical protein CAPTEDRAFT_205364 [Capitella teleta]